MRALRLYATTLLALSPLAAQHQGSGSASSTTYFMSAVEFGSGSPADSVLYRLRPSQGSGLVAEPGSASATYVLRGGFTAALSAPILGRPWLTGAEPYWVPPNGSPAVTLHGTEMSQGTLPIVTIGGQPATVGPRTLDRITVTLPPQPVPGFQPIQVTNNLGITRINEGVGVLPMFERREPLNNSDPNYMRFHGTFGDLMFVAVAVASAPVPFVLPGYGYSLQLDPNSFLITDGFFIGSADGTLTFPLPPLPPGIFRVQALVVTTNPGYAPGSWTNQLLL